MCSSAKQPVVYKTGIPAGCNGNRRGRRIAEWVKNHIRNNLSADLSAAAVAKEFGLSVSSLLHLFTEQQQITFQRYVMEARMQKAFETILRGGRVKEAMHATGYRHRSSFNKAFKKAFKHPPSYFR